MSIQQELRELEAYTNAKGLAPGLSHIHVDKDSNAWAGDGDVELYIANSGLPHGPWRANAERVLALAKAAGDGCTLELQETDLLVGKGNFAGLVPLAAKEEHLPSLHEQYAATGKPQSLELAGHNAQSFTKAIKHVAPWAAQDIAAGAYWSGVLLRGDAGIYASDQGFHIACAKLHFPYRKGGEDILIPARAALSAANAGEIAGLEVNPKTGIGRFQLHSGHQVYFRLLAVVDPRHKNKYPDAQAVLDTAPDVQYGVTTGMLELTQRIGVVANSKDPVIDLEKDEDGWFMSCAGNGKASDTTPETFQPGSECTPARLTPTRWQQLFEHASEIAPVASRIWFRSDFNFGEVTPGNNAGFLLTGCVSAMTAGE